MAVKYNVSVPQLCIRYTLQLGTISLPKTANPAHMESNAQVDFEISAEDMELLSISSISKAMVRAVVSRYMEVSCNSRSVKIYFLEGSCLIL